MTRASNGREYLFAACAAFAVVACLLPWLWLSRAPGPSGVVEHGESGGAGSKPPSDPAALSVSLLSPGTEGESRAIEGVGNTSHVTQSPDTDSISGVVSFVDGSIPPPLGLRLSLYKDEADQVIVPRNRVDPNHPCQPEVVVDTGADGRFWASGLCPGRYRASTVPPTSIGVADGLFAVPSKDVSVVLPGYLLIVRTIEPAGHPIGKAYISAEYLRDGSYHYPDPKPIMLRRTTDESGYCYLWLPDPGEVLLQVLGLGPESQPDLVSLRNAPGVVRKQLLLPGMPARADLRLSLSSCDVLHGPIRDYWVHLEDPSTGRYMLLLRSEDAVDGGLFRGIPPGRYRVSPVPRYSGNPAYYIPQPGASSPLIELEDGKEGLVSICLPVGGRLLLLARSQGEKGSVSTSDVRVAIVTSAGVAAKWLNFRQPDATGVTIDARLPLGVERLSEDVLEPGKYVLRVTADGYRDLDVPVSLIAGEATRLEVELYISD